MIRDGFDISCSRCPHMRGHDYCAFRKSPVNRNNMMCRQGFYDRMINGMDKAAILYSQNKFDERIDKTLASLSRFQNLYYQLENERVFEQTN